jgi:CRISPR-associated endonuclease/helicase Cas3
VNVLLVSECSGAALNQTRRILDQFSERRGERVWQTVITLAGLDTLRRLLRQRARKNTAVACYRIYGAQTELLWIVGSADRFGPQGAVPTNRTRRDILRTKDENTWHSLAAISLLARLAALWHDVGKACAQFQRILRSKTPQKNIIRHEWISLRLFEAFVADDDDKTWLARLSAFGGSNTADIPTRLRRDKADALQHRDTKPFAGLPPLAQAVGWLIVSHHRLPTTPEAENRSPEVLTALPAGIVREWNERSPIEAPEAEEYWDLPADLFLRLGEKWQKRVRKYAARLEALPHFPHSDPFVLHLARLILMLADHKVSAEAAQKSHEQPKSTSRRKELHANTDRHGNLKQTLPEHLLRVSDMCGMIAHALPLFADDLPRLARHRGLQRRSADDRFRWQDKAVDACAAIGERSATGGAFLVNMASTGCGKTLANIRMLYALNRPERGMRACFALGLRVLTTQTGREYQKRLHLAQDELAVRVGGLAGRELYDLFTRQAAEQTQDEKKALEAQWQDLARQGLESARELWNDQDHVLFEGGAEEHPAVARVLEDTNARAFLSAPILACTVDHLVPGTESLRGGHQILPMLRLLSGDLVLDEIDDYSLDDLPAIARLTYWAGMLGCRVLVSSATMPPSLAAGLFAAYREGRAVFQKNRGERPEETPIIPCVWTDEFRSHVAEITDEHGFTAAHHAFARKRAERVVKAPHRRLGQLLDMESLRNCSERKLPEEVARKLLRGALGLHADNHTEIRGKRVSFGVMRMANIGPLRRVARALCSLSAPENTRVHVLVYHSRFPLCVRAKIEELLDRCLVRKDPQTVFDEPEVRACLQSPERDHIFLILASPVCEVGRDWDQDWAIAEPSSMRSLIQLAGRIRRHRSGTYDTVNLLIWSRNFRSLTRPDKSAFLRPGFESPHNRAFMLQSHTLEKILLPEQYERIDSRPRLLPREPLEPRNNLADLEHARLARLFAGEPARELTAREIRAGLTAQAPGICASSWWLQPQSMLTGVLQQWQPFRKPGRPEADFVLLPNEDEDAWVLTAVNKFGETAWEEKLTRIVDAGSPEIRQDADVFVWGQGMGPWLVVDIMDTLHDLAEEKDTDLETCARKFATLTLPESEVGGWTFHPLLGFDCKR